MIYNLHRKLNKHNDIFLQTFQSSWDAPINPCGGDDNDDDGDNDDGENENDNDGVDYDASDDDDNDGSDDDDDGDDDDDDDDNDDDDDCFTTNNTRLKNTITPEMLLN